MNPIRQYAPWLTPQKGLIAGYGIVLLAIYLWPNADLIIEIVLLAAIPGAIAAIVWGLTFWQTARVQIGRRQLKYRSVRRIAGLVGLACLPFLIIWEVSIWAHRPPDLSALVAERSAQIRAHFRFVVAFTHLEGDESDRIVNRMTEAIRNLDKRLNVSSIVINHSVRASSEIGMSHLEAMGLASDADANLLVWGKAPRASSNRDSAIYATGASFAEPFSGTYLPSDFALPDMELDQFCDVLRLVVAAQDGVLMHNWGYQFGDALEPLIKKVRALASEANNTSKWSADTRARVDFVLGIATRVSANEIDSGDAIGRSVADFQRALGGWTRESNPLEWAMTKLNLGFTMRILAEYHFDEGLVRRALDCFKSALEVYQSKGDRLDSAGVQVQTGVALDLIATRTGKVEFVPQAIDAYRAALQSYDPKNQPWSWAATQINLAAALSAMGDQQPNPQFFRDAVAAERAALSIYRQRRGSEQWATAQMDLAASLRTLGKLTSNRDNLSEAIAVSRDTLSSFPRDLDPKIWALAQIHLGEALCAFGQFTSDIETLEEAGAAFKAALTALSVDNQPSEWGEAMDGLGETYGSLGDKTKDTFYYRQAVAAYEKVLTVYTRESDPLRWAWAEYNLGNALYDVGAREAGSKNIENSIECYRAALSALSKEKNAEQWTEVQENLDVALHELGRRG